MKVGAVSPQNSLFRTYSQLSSGKRINSAKDDAAGFAIASRMRMQETGYKVGTDNAGMAVATSPSGGGMHIQMENSTLEALGIADLDVTSKDFSLDSIDKALDMVSERRSSLGASTNALQHTQNFNNSAAINQLSSRSRLEDLDFPKAIAKKKQDEVFGQYRMAMLRRQMDEKRKSAAALF